MHILLVTHYFAPENNAPSRRWEALGTRLTAAGHELTVVAPPPHYEAGRVSAEDSEQFGPGRIHATYYGATVLRTSYLNHGANVVSRTADHLVAASDTVRRARRYLRSRRAPDVVIATAPGIPSLLAGRKLAKHFNAPLITEMRDAWPDLVTHTPGLSSGRGLVGLAKRGIHGRVTSWQRESDRVVTTTRRFAEVLVRRGVPHPAVIRNGTTAGLLFDLPERTPDGMLRALYMGNLGRSQGLDTVVRAAARARDAGSPIHVRFVGHGAAKRVLLDLNTRLGSPVEILDSIPANDVREQYEWADSVIVSLRDWEPFEWTIPSKLYEALATGKHITGLLAGEAAGVVRETSSGDVVPPGDCAGVVALWNGLIEDPSRLQTGSAGIEWVRENANYDTLAEQYEDVLREVVDDDAA